MNKGRNSIVQIEETMILVKTVTSFEALFIYLTHAKHKQFMRILKEMSTKNTSKGERDEQEL